MRNRSSSARRRYLLFAVSLLQLAAAAQAQTIRSRPVPQSVVESRLQRYAGNDSQRAATIKEIFTQVGCAGDHLMEQPVKGSKLSNVICVLPGTDDRVIIVGAHYDHISAGDGVVDNWSGASLLPSLYEAINIEPRRHTFIFIAFTDEEKGEVGSHFYVKEMTKEQIAATDAMVNMDTLGLAPTEIWTTHSDKRLTSLLVSLANQLKLPVSGVNVEKVGTTDSEQFAARKIPSITIHSLTQETWSAGILHSSKDKLSAINFEDYYQTYRLIATYLALLDTALPPPAPPPH